MFPQTHKELILASTSESRKLMLKAAGLAFRVEAPGVDEGAIIEGLGGSDLTPSDLAELLARTKAETVSAMHGNACVIGGDQVLSFDGRIFSKPMSRNEARDMLLELRGETHSLHSAVAVAFGGQTSWTRVETAQMTMRHFSAEYIGAYLGTVGEDICRSVGAYEIEGAGAHLFYHIDGDHFTIRGMPLIPLLNYLYDDDVLS